jgi:tape measure domain-containing protein
MFKVSYIYDLVDNISPQLKKIQSNLEQTRTKTQAIAQSMSSSFDKVGQSLTNTSRSIKNAGTTLAPLSVAMGGVAIKALSSAANFEKLQMQMEVLTGSAEKGKEVFKKLVEFAAATPFELPELVKANNTLMGFGMTAEDAFDSLKMIGDVSAVAGGDLQGITVAFGQAAASGRLMGQDLLQLVNNGVPVIDMLASSMGVAKERIKDMVSEGKITLPVLTKAFRDATSEGGKFNNGMDKLSKTLGGVYSTLKDSVNIAFAELGSEMAKSINLNELIKNLSDFAGKLTEKFKSLSPETKKFITYLVLAATVIAPLLLALGSLIGILGLAFSGFALLAGGFAFLFTPLGLITAAFLALAAAIHGIKYVLGVVREFLKDKLLSIFDLISLKIESLIGKINELRSNAASILDFVGLEGAANFVSPEINQNINKPQQMTAGGQLDVNIKGLPKGSSAGFTPRPNNFLPVGLNTVYAGG